LTEWLDRNDLKSFPGPKGESAPLRWREFWTEEDRLSGNAPITRQNRAKNKEWTIYKFATISARRLDGSEARQPPGWWWGIVRCAKEGDRQG